MAKMGTKAVISVKTRVSQQDKIGLPGYPSGSVTESKDLDVRWSDRQWHRQLQEQNPFRE